MWMTEIPAFLPFFIGALLAVVTRGHLRSAILLTIPVLSAIHLWTVPEGIHLQYTILDYELNPYRVDKLSLMFGYVFHIAAFIAVLYSTHVKDTTQQVAGILYAGSALGAVFAGDLLTLFIFWELLTFSSVFLIWARGTGRAYAAGIRYLIIQVLSGVILFAGAMFYYSENATLVFEYIGLEGIAGWLIFIAFGIKCAFPFMHNWLTDAYPEATVTGTVFLSAFTTKVAIYTLARGYPGTDLLIYIGGAMACFPIFYAVIENDLRRVLAYSLINQLGFMVVGIGIGTALALNGAISHAFSHIIYKSLLFMSMGAVLHMTGRINGSDLGGLYKTMPKTTVLCIIGAASISAFPLFSGFISKSMVITAALNNDHDIIWMVLLFASAGVFHHAGIKIPYFAFFAHDSGIRVSDPPVNMTLAMVIAAFFCLAIGMFPSVLYSLLPYDTGYNPYDASHVLAQMQLLFFSALAFVWLNLKGLYPPELHSTNLDFDWTYRRLFPEAISKLFAMIWWLDTAVRQVFVSGLNSSLAFIGKRQIGVSGLLSRTYPASSMVMWVAVILATYLFLSFITH
jgi:multicomponent Na+:H+ antiporter subunit D